MALPASFLDELRARTPLAPLVARRVKLARSGREWKGCCPFHNEKTPSFYVYDDGFHCFGCGAHGDAIGFVMRMDGADFREAVERLAGEAGLEVPKPTMAAAQAEQRRLDLFGVLEAAAVAFARRLAASEGERAREYLARRGVTGEAVGGFGLGWSGEGRAALLADLGPLGATEELLIQAGLMTQPDAGPRRAFFFNRLMFPIRDARGRVIGFGGRTLGDGQPKYLNGPETEVFAKRRTLYGIDRARGAARDGKPVVVVEGYLDVIALHEAGFPGAVAPLGTALTEEHLADLWKLSPAPILCFDGDAAGGRAAARAAKLALPRVAPDRSLRFARLDAGEDPDSLIRKHGPARMGEILATTQPLADTLYALVRESAGDDTPEQRAAFRTALEASAREVRHPALAAELRRAWLDRFFAEHRHGAARHRPHAMAAPRPDPSAQAADLMRVRILLALLLRHPDILHAEEEVVATLAVPPPLQAIQATMLDCVHLSENLDAERLMNHVRATGYGADVEALTRGIDSILPAGARPTAMPAEALETFWHYVGLLRRSTLAEELASAREAFAKQCDEPSQRRLIALRTAQERLHADMSAGSA